MESIFIGARIDNHDAICRLSFVNKDIERFPMIGNILDEAQFQIKKKVAITSLLRSPKDEYMYGNKTIELFVMIDNLNEAHFHIKKKIVIMPLHGSPKLCMYRFRRRCEGNYYFDT